MFRTSPISAAGASEPEQPVPRWKKISEIQEIGTTPSSARTTTEELSLPPVQGDPPTQNFALNTNIALKQHAGATQASYTRKNKSNHFAPSILTVRHAPQRSDRGKTVRTHQNPGILGNPRSVAEDFGIFTVLRSKSRPAGRASMTSGQNRRS